MTKARFVVVLLFTLALAYCPPVLAQQGPGPGGGVLESPGGPLAEVTERFYDFGDMSAGKQYEHGFVVKNVGTAPLEIRKVIKI